MEYRHTPVMMTEAIEFLRPQSGNKFIDCTLGGGGYTSVLATAVGQDGVIIAIDVDQLAIANAQQKFKNFSNVFLVQDNFKNLPKIVHNIFKDEGEVKFDGIVFDLGLSSAQLADQQRGLSFQYDAPLNMSLGEMPVERTAQIINSWREDELYHAIKNYGEERYARQIAHRIVLARSKKKISTTSELLAIIAAAVPANYRHHHHLHFATRTFQALRIATNDELVNLQSALPLATKLLTSGGRLVVVSYQSLEDRIVKTFFKNESHDCLCQPDSIICQCHHQACLKIITKKPLVPTSDEIKTNPRARSAKLRAAEKI
ncbi:MAG: 16S rRNA (cytosine(1402)-N(4))-methyltransferase RsmH [Candidatus Falkowbacteria bacterium]|nr:16S rRNA (cytosine(1402)-N(4))-methyltransferase RsmH [Candidatus Falkowbacteria bacterium]